MRGLSAMGYNPTAVRDAVQSGLAWVIYPMALG